ncbi:MAG TPA: DUF1772 domain-containing protein [Thermoanaerobaculia bacterium]|nr:DUF1772 domain-containing protein [Thermoanaerobaculia bacterium]
MNRAVESVLRFVHLTSSGLLAGSLGFGGSALFPGWEEELPEDRKGEAARRLKAFNAIGPAALASSVALMVAGNRDSNLRRLLDLGSAASLAGALGATFLGTVPLNRKITQDYPRDYASDDHLSQTKNWSRAHALRTTLGVSAFVMAVGASVLAAQKSSR